MNNKTHPRHRHALTALLATLLCSGMPVNAVADDTTAGTTPGPREQAQQDAEEIARQLLKVRDDEVELSCDKGVENARYGLETMLEVGAKNVKGGYMPQAQYDAMAKPMKALLPQITLTDCEAADGNKQAFYRCMSNQWNHVLACAQAHPF